MTNEQITKICNQLKENRASLHIDRIPIDTKRQFRELSEAEFCSDYGMCLKYLLDYTLNDQKMLLIHARLDEIEARLKQLEYKPEKTQIKMLDGNIKKGIKKEV